MNTIRRIGRHHIVLICIIFLASFLRFIYLDRIPNAISGDELLYAITAKSIYLTGHDISGTWNPLSAFAFQYPPGEHQAELPYFIHLIFTGPFPFSLLLFKLPFALLSIGIVIIVYKIAEVLFGIKTAECTGFITAINPWLIVMGRTGYEATPATFFYLLSLYMFLTLQSWKVLWTLIPLFLAFYSYIGTKLIFIPYILIALFLAYETNHHKFQKIYALLFSVCVLFTLGFIVLLHSSSGGSRMSEIVFPSSPLVSQQVDALRQNAIQSPLLTIFVNKYTMYVQRIMEKLFRILSPSYLFVEGDQFFLPVKQSFFYFVDIIFIGLGSLYLFSKNKLKFTILILFILVGTFPHVFHNNIGDFSIHLTLMFPFVILLIGLGISNVIHNVSRTYKSITVLSIMFVYIASLGGFSTNYFYQYPLRGAGDFPMRVLSHYLSLTNSHTTIYSTTSRDVFKKFIFFTNSMTRQSMPNITRVYSQKTQNEFQNIRFVSCDKTVKSIPENNPVIYDVNCGMNIEVPHIQISRLIDAGAIYNIYHDTLCSKYKLNPYPMGVKISDFNMEKISTERFCKTYFN